MYGQEITNMLDMFPLNCPCFEILYKISCGLFMGGNFSWGRIFAFIHFAVRLFLRSIKNPLIVPINLCIEIVYALGAIFAQGAFTWIANHGGWRRIVPPDRIVTSVRNSPLCSPLGLIVAAGMIVFVLTFRLWRSKV
ncbi:unnamed protein product [Hymenolepis diminuta]|uniref:Bcl-2 Bcl-2 homology region 1-3 domain-containing protein n=1 Tax=Hymenolepis diminuta TaxID=6216 RepID=A0A564Y455_HYMDI|nr:unnamed protein product [Hymenolepis diminuta]